MPTVDIAHPPASRRPKLHSAVCRFLERAAQDETLFLVLVLRLALTILGAASLLVGERYTPGGDWADLAVAPGQPGYLLYNPWQRWDALWYIKIAADGYAPDNGSTAFFPLFPLAMRLAGTALGGPLTAGGLLIVTIAFVAALVLLRKLAAIEFGPAVAGRTVQYLAFFPTAFFFFAPFTESFFLLAVVGAMYGARTGRWWLAGAAGLFAGLTRPQGLLLVLPLAYEYVRQHPRLTPGTVLRALPVLSPGVSWLAFMAYTTLLSGKMPGQELKDHWGYSVALPTEVLAAAMRHAASGPDWIEALNLASLVLFALAAILGLRRLPFSYFLYVVPQLALLSTREMYFSPLMSASRYVLPLFPAFILLALYTERRIVRYALLLAFLGLLAALFDRFVRWGFVA